MTIKLSNKKKILTQTKVRMKNSLTGFLIIFMAGFCSLSAKDNITAGKRGIVVIESESTSSSLGKWNKKTDVKNFSGECHLEFTGNRPTSGKPTSPLKYKFTVDRDGDYHFYIRGFKRLTDDKGVKARNDHCNDCFVRLEGDFESASEISKDVLEEDQKFFIHGKSHEQWDWAKTLEYRHPKDKKQHGKKPPVYKLKKGQTYTLIISGRSQRFNMDKIVFISSKLDQRKTLAKENK